MTQYWEDRILKAQEKEAKDCLRILRAVQRRPLRYSQIKRLLNIKPDRLERILKVLRKDFWIVARAVPNKAWIKHYESQKEIAIPDRVVPPKNCKILAVYELTKRGASILRAHVK